MFHIVICSYLKPPSELASRMEEHQTYLEALHREGSFLLSGAKPSRDGCVIIAQTETRAELVDILNGDPLGKDNLIRYEIIEFNLNVRTLALTEELFLGNKSLSQRIKADDSAHNHATNA